MLNDIQRGQFIKSLRNLEWDEERETKESDAKIFGRHFTVALTDSGCFYPFELKPSGVLFKGSKLPVNKRFDHSRADTIRDAFNADPNGFEAWCISNDVPMNELCRSGGGFSVGTIVFSTLDEAVNAAVQSVESNTLYRQFRTKEEMNAEKDDATLRAEAKAELEQSIAFWESQIFEEGDTPSLVTQLKNGFGKQLNDDRRKAIISYLNKPNLEQWHDIKSILITPLDTIWQCYAKCYPGVPFSGNDFDANNIPDKEAITDVLRSAMSMHNERARGKLKPLREKYETEFGDDKASHLTAVI